MANNPHPTPSTKSNDPNHSEFPTENQTQLVNLAIGVAAHDDKMDFKAALNAKRKHPSSLSLPEISWLLESANEMVNRQPTLSLYIVLLLTDDLKLLEDAELWKQKEEVASQASKLLKVDPLSIWKEATNAPLPLPEQENPSLTDDGSGQNSLGGNLPEGEVQPQANPSSSTPVIQIIIVTIIGIMVLAAIFFTIQSNPSFLSTTEVNLTSPIIPQATPTGNEEILLTYTPVSTPMHSPIPTYTLSPSVITTSDQKGEIVFSDDFDIQGLDWWDSVENATLTQGRNNQGVRINATNENFAIIIRLAHTFKKDESYRASAWCKASQNTKCRIFFGDPINYGSLPSPTYEHEVNGEADGNDEWQKVTTPIIMMEHDEYMSVYLYSLVEGTSVIYDDVIVERVDNSP